MARMNRLTLILLLLLVNTAEARRWTDASGRHTIEADLIDVVNGQVRLKRNDGRVLTMPVTKLSKTDQAYLKTNPQPTAKADAQLDRAAILAALNKPTQLEFVETPLNSVLQFLSDLHRVPIKLNKDVLPNGGAEPVMQTPITANSKGKKFRQGLDLLLQPNGLAWVIQDGGLLITTQQDARARARK